MLAKERQKKIEKLLAENGAVLASELTARFGVSIETVRRDLLYMESEEKLVRVHGGAVVKGDMTPPRSFAERHQTMESEKISLATEAAKYVEEGVTTVRRERRAFSAFANAMAVLPSSMPITSPWRFLPK